MKFNLLFVTLIVAVTAAPTSLVRRHGHHGLGQRANNVNPAQPSSSLSPQQANPNTGHGGHDHHRGGHRGGSTTQPPASAPTPVITTPAATVIQGAQKTTAAANVGQTNNNGQANTGTQNSNNGAINPNLVPDFGLQAGLQPDGTGNCKTNTGKLIPCSCPPSRAAFLQKLGQFVQAGSFPGGGAAPFPTGNSNADARTRIDTIVSTLQNFNGKPGSGCPIISAPNIQALQQQLQR